MAEATARELEKYREQARAWFRDNIPAWWREISSSPFEAGETHFDELRAWHQQLYAAGYLGIQWAPEYGGQGLSLQHDMIVNEERALADAPRQRAVTRKERARAWG